MIFHYSDKTSRVRKFTLSSQRRTFRNLHKPKYLRIAHYGNLCDIIFCEYLGCQIFLEQSRNFGLNL